MLTLLVAPVSAQEAPPVTWAPVVDVRGRVLLRAEGTIQRAIEQRARGGIEVARGGVSARVSFQAIRGWTSDASGIQVTSPFTPEIAEGWAQVNGAWTPSVGATLTLGRQDIEIGDGRIVGRRDWDMAGQFLDALRIEVRAAPVEVEYVNARRFVLSEGDPLGFGVNVLRLGFGREGGITSWHADVLSVVDARDTAETTATAGVFGRISTGRLRGRAEAYVQSNSGGAASLAGARGGWVFGPDEGWTVGAGMDVASGSRPGTGVSAFLPVLGDTHGVWGLLDLFGIPGDTSDRGVVDAHVRVEARPARPFRADLYVHAFASPVDGAPFGAEVDLTVSWAFSPFATLEGGYAHFFPVPSFRPEPVDSGYVVFDVAF